MVKAMQFSTEIIAGRRREILAEVQTHRAEIAKLEEELVELDSAERVIARLSGKPFPPKEPNQTGPEAVAQKGKPENTPTMPEMIRSALSHAFSHELNTAMPVPAIAERIRAQHKWPELENAVVGSIAWRMWKRGHLAKNGHLYSLPGAVPEIESDAEA
jgi:hypothetical protein